MNIELKNIKAPTKFQSRIANNFISAASMTCVGQAKGHDLWLDQTFLQQIIQKTTNKQLKVRFSHPEGQELGLALGTANNFYIDGEKVRCNISFLKSAVISPQGNLVDYIKTLAEQKPQYLGLSIVFDIDINAMMNFTNSNLDADNNFKSPDPRNVNNYQHVRLAQIYGVDFVGQPACGVGLFSKGTNIIKQIKETVTILQQEIKNMSELANPNPQDNAPANDPQNAPQPQEPAKAPFDAQAKYNELQAIVAALVEKVNSIQASLVDFAKVEKVEEMKNINAELTNKVQELSNIKSQVKFNARQGGVPPNPVANDINKEVKKSVFATINEKLSKK